MISNKVTSRPLSPHMQIYRPMLTMLMSIAHRITGAALYFGMAFLIGWLLAASYSEASFIQMSTIIKSWVGQIMLFGLSWALIHHAFGGIRHLIWDVGYGFGLKNIERLALLNLIIPTIINLTLWIFALGVKF